MRAIAILLLAGLTACNSGPSVTAENASANQIDAQLAAAGGGAAQFLSPGHWDTVSTIHDMEVPGLPPEAAARMKEGLGEPTKSASCLTPEEAKKPAASFLAGGDDSDCRYDHFSMANGTIDAALRCEGEGAAQTVRMKGTFTADAFHIDMASQSTGTGPSANMSMAATIEGTRAGACTGTEED